MSIRWLITAQSDLSSLIEWYQRNAPDSLSDVAQNIWDAAESLKVMPNRGRNGFIKGTRELLVPHLPYMLVYKISKKNIAILRLLHQSQNWPDA